MLHLYIKTWLVSFLISLLTQSMDQGSYVYDIEGKKYLDSLAGLWCTALGIYEYFSICFVLCLIIDIPLFPLPSRWHKNMHFVTHAFYLFFWYVSGNIWLCSVLCPSNINMFYISASFILNPVSDFLCLKKLIKFETIVAKYITSNLHALQTMIKKFKEVT